MYKKRILIWLLAAIPTAVCGQHVSGKSFKGFKGTIVIYDQGADKYITHNEDRAATPYSPFSTYKIPHSIIALETKIISNTEQIIQWEEKKYPAETWWPKTWAGEHNLRSAIKFSVVPAYRHLATLIGDSVMQRYVDRFEFGNKDISSGLDSFWLNGSLRITAYEQVAFLKKFYNSQLKISAQTERNVKNILLQEQTENYKLSAKTGGGTIGRDQSAALGWYVGYLEKADNVYFFALNIEGNSFNEILKPRVLITKSIFRALGIIQ